MEVRVVMRMSMKSINELKMQLCRRYQGATKEEKSKMIDEFTASSGYNRSYAYDEVKKLRDSQVHRPVKVCDVISQIILTIPSHAELDAFPH